MVPWCSWLSRLTVYQKIRGSNPTFGTKSESSQSQIFHFISFLGARGQSLQKPTYIAGWSSGSFPVS